MAHIPIDAHVHLHPGVDPARCLSAAASNMVHVWKDVRVGVLMLTESAGAEAFSSLSGPLGDWQIIPTAEDTSLMAQRDDGTRIFVIAGRQVVTAEGLEVHALGSKTGPEDGLPLDLTLKAIRKTGALAVLPWGVGKWTGHRGAVLDGLIDGERASRDLFLADSGVRPARMLRPTRLMQAEALGWRVLAGTDPLPLAGEETKPGRFGFLVKDVPDPRRPFAMLAAWLKAQERSPATYGALETLPRFLSQQIRMQIRKRTG